MSKLKAAALLAAAAGAAATIAVLDRVIKVTTPKEKAEPKMPEGKPISVKYNGEGKIESAAFDTTGDGKADTILVDTNGDGQLDTAYVDTTGDGKVDSILDLNENKAEV